MLAAGKLAFALIRKHAYMYNMFSMRIWVAIVKYMYYIKINNKKKPLRPKYLGTTYIE